MQIFAYLTESPWNIGMLELLDHAHAAHLLSRCPTAQNGDLSPGLTSVVTEGLMPTGLFEAMPIFSQK